MSENAVIEKENIINKSAIKDFAVSARKKLNDRVQMQANRMGFYADNRALNFEFEDDKQVKINGEIFDKKQINILKNQIQHKGFDAVIDEVAYTWFNRFIALYFMEVHNYIDNGLNIISSLDEINSIALKAPSYFKNINKEQLFTLVQDNKSEDVYKTLIIAQCNELSAKLPFLFEQISDYTELLFPQGMLNNDSVIREMLALDKQSWNEVEIIGWLYQYYNQAEKDRVIQAKKRYKKNEIPFATQLFTPKWIVKYMTQNSLGRLWQESKPYSNLKEDMEFYLEPRNLTEEDKKELEEHILKNILPENIKVFDPACGSGHILVYAYSLLYKMYQESGYIQEEIPSLILKNNLFGLDLCKRASQLAQLAVLLRAREDDKQIFNKYQELNIRCIENSKEITNEEIAFVAEQNSGEDFDNIKEFVECFENADIYGSLCKLPSVDYNYYFDKIEALKTKMSESLFLNSITIYNKFLPLLKQFKIMQQQYECIITNPPYMGNKYMETKLAEFIQKEYKDVKSDLFSAFMVYSQHKLKENGYLGCITPVVWFFTSSYNYLRQYVLDNLSFSSIVQLEHNAFEAAAIPVITFTMRNSTSSLPLEGIKLSDYSGPEVQPFKLKEAIKNPNVHYRHTAKMNSFKSMPNNAFAFFMTNKVIDIFKNNISLGKLTIPRQGMATTDNNRFLRLWHEVNNRKMNYTAISRDNAKLSLKKWFPYNKGGLFRKWYGNNEFVVNYENDGSELINLVIDKYPKISDPEFVIKNRNCYFKPAITWTFVAINFGVRLVDYGYIFDVAGSSLFLDDIEERYYLSAFLNSKIANNFMYALNPTINFQAGDVASLPIIKTDNSSIFNKIVNLVEQNIQISKDDWDSFETSWDFAQHPLTRFRTLHHPEFISGSDQQEILKQVQNDNFKVQESFNAWKEHKEQQFNQLKANEEELNRLFIEIYGLQDEMTPEVADKDITLKGATESEQDCIKSLLSYAVGCMFGRYSLDVKGLAFAGGEFDSSKYKSLEVDEDAILPILGDTWFDDDIIEEFKRFLKAAFGELYFNENMQYIADVLGRKSGESAEDKIRNYFLKDFFKDHVQMYKKRPIYWMFTSGKEKAFNCLVYLHRYDKITLSRLRKDYLHEFQAKLDRAKEQAEKEGNIKLTSQYAKYQSELLEFDRRLQQFADQQIELDLDDGVKVNYAKFKGLLEMEKDIIGKEK